MKTIIVTQLTILLVSWCQKGVMARSLEINNEENLLPFFGEKTLKLHREISQSQRPANDFALRQLDGYYGIDYSKATSRFMLDLYAELQKGESIAKASGHQTGHHSGPLDVLDTDTIRCFSSPGSSKGSSSKALFEFRVPRLPKNEQLALAEFRVPRQNSKKHPRKLKIHLKRGPVQVKSLVVRRKPYPTSDKNYLVYDITSSLRALINGYHGNMTVRLQVRDKWNGKLDSDLEAVKARDVDGRQEEGLLVFYSENRGFLGQMYSSYTEQESRDGKQGKSRRQRSLRDGPQRRRRKNRGKWTPKKSKKSGNLCQKFDFYVDFNKIGWGRWIVFPKRFNAFVCHGKCPSPVPNQLQPTNHAMLQSLMRAQRTSAAPMPCCVPNKLKPLSMIYYEHDEILVRHHENMIADECGCK